VTGTTDNVGKIDVTHWICFFKAGCLPCHNRTRNLEFLDIGSNGDLRCPCLSENIQFPSLFTKIERDTKRRRWPSIRMVLKSLTFSKCQCTYCHFRNVLPDDTGWIQGNFLWRTARADGEKHFIGLSSGFRTSIHAHWWYKPFFNICSIEASPSTDTGEEICCDRRHLKLALSLWGDIWAVPHDPATIITLSIFSFQPMFLSRQWWLHSWYPKSIPDWGHSAMKLRKTLHLRNVSSNGAVLAI
jgi:hypothetical protein